MLSSLQKVCSKVNLPFSRSFFFDRGHSKGAAWQAQGGREWQCRCYIRTNFVRLISDNELGQDEELVSDVPCLRREEGSNSQNQNGDTTCGPCAAMSSHHCQATEYSVRWTRREWVVTSPRSRVR